MHAWDDWDLVFIIKLLIRTYITEKLNCRNIKFAENKFFLKVEIYRNFTQLSSFVSSYIPIRTDPHDTQGIITCSSYNLLMSIAQTLAHSAHSYTASDKALHVS